MIVRFYVNTYTKKSQWEKPTSSAQPDEGAPAGAPPGYTNPGGVTVSDHKKAPLESNNPYNQSSQSSAADSDAQLAAKLQELLDEHRALIREGFLEEGPALPTVPPGHDAVAGQTTL